MNYDPISPRMPQKSTKLLQRIAKKRWSKTRTGQNRHLTLTFAPLWFNGRQCSNLSYSCISDESFGLKLVVINKSITTLIYRDIDNIYLLSFLNVHWSFESKSCAWLVQCLRNIQINHLEIFFLFKRRTRKFPHSCQSSRLFEIVHSPCRRARSSLLHLWSSRAATLFQHSSPFSIARGESCTLFFSGSIQ